MTTMMKAASTAENTPFATLDRETRSVSLSELYLHPLNPRRRVSEEEIEAMALSIGSIGLMQNLLGLEEPDEEGLSIGIVGGGRRLRGLRHMAEAQGIDPATIMVPVKLALDASEAEAWGNAENAARMALHPADEIAAYAAMIDHGGTARQVAKAFAVSERHVQGRIKLAALAKPVLDALKENAISLEQTAALAISDDVALQEEALHDAIRWDSDPSDIRARLTHTAIKAGTGLARFVTREEYEAAGGTIREDLFGDDIWFEDRDILEQVAQIKLDALAGDIRAEHWAWVEAVPQRLDYTMTTEFIRTHPEQAEFSDAEEAEYNALAAVIEGGSASEVETERFDVLDAKLAEERYTDAQRDVAGVLIGFDYDYSVRIERGLIRKDNRRAAIKAGVITGPQSEKSDTPPKPYSAALSSDLAAIRTGAAQQALLDQPDLALDLLAFALSGEQTPLDIRMGHAANHPGVEDGYALDTRLNGPDSAQFANPKTIARRFTAFRKKPQAERMALLVEAVARSMEGGMAGETANPLFEQIASLCNAQTRSVWTPTEGFFKRLKSAQLDTIWCHLHGKKTADGFVQKKAAKAAYLHALFTDDAFKAQQDEATRARIDAWVPEGMEIVSSKAAAMTKKPARKKAAKQGVKPTSPTTPCAAVSTAA